MQIVHPGPIIDQVLRLIQANQGTSASGAIKAVLDSQTWTLPTGVAYITDLAPVGQFEKDLDARVVTRPCVTATAQTQFADPRSNEGANVVHRIIVECWISDADRGVKMAQAYLYGQLLHLIFTELTSPSDLTTGVTNLMALWLRPQELRYGAFELNDRRAFEGGVVFAFDVGCLSR